MARVTIYVRDANGEGTPTPGDFLGARTVPIHKAAFGVEGAATMVSTADPLPITLAQSTRDAIEAAL